MAEAGLPGFDISTWFGLMAPAGTPPDVIAKWNADIVKVLNSPDVREKMIGAGRRARADDVGRVRRRSSRASSTSTRGS